MKLFIYIFVFYAMKASPRTIDNKTHPFWRWCVKELNSHRKDSWVFYSFGRLKVRDMHAHPQRDIFAFSKFHPFVWRR